MQALINRLFEKNNFLYFSLALSFLVLIVHTYFDLKYGMNIFVILFLLICLFREDRKELFKVMIIPTLLFYVYEIGRAHAFQLSEMFGFKLWVEEIINIEKELFFFLDNIPTVELQELLLRNPSDPYLYDYLLFIFYGVFFWLWAIIALVIWQYKKEFIYKYIYGLIAFSLFSVVLFIIIPTAPPWFASELNLIPNVDRILWEFNYIDGLNLTETQSYGRNDFAAIPSLHVGWVTFACLYIIRAFGEKYIWTLIVPLVIGFATWYGAEHYIIDSIIGAAIAIAFFYISNRFIPDYKT